MTTTPPRPDAALPPGAWVVALALSAGLATGCSQGFDPYNRLTTPRVLAIRSEPVAPAPGETTTLDSLLYMPPGDAVASMSWSWCPFAGPAEQGYPCLISEEDLAELGDEVSSSVPPFDLGSGETATFEHSLDPDLLDAVCRGTADQPELLDCEGGFPAQIKLTMQTESGAEVTSVRTLRLRFADSDEPNQNPQVEGMVAIVDDEEQEIGDEPTVTLPRRQETLLRVQVPPDAIESYTGVAENREPEERVEQLILTWFVESGGTKSERTTFLDGVEPLEDAVENDWEPDNTRDYPRDTAQVVVVVRDDRDGVAWQRGVVRLGEQP